MLDGGLGKLHKRMKRFGDTVGPWLFGLYRVESVTKSLSLAVEPR